MLIRLIVGMLPALSILAAEPAVAGAAPAGAAAPVVIRIYGGSALESEANKVQNQYFRLYEQQNPHVKIENLGREHDTNKLTTLFLADEAPDVIEHGSGFIIDYYRQGVIQPVPASLATRLTRVAFPVSIQSVTEEGVMVGVPVENMVTGLWYGQQAMAEAGIAGPPKSVDELERVARRAAKVTADGKLESAGLAHSGDQTWALDQMAVAMLAAEGGQVVDGAGKLIISGPPLQRVVNRLVAWIGKRDFFDFSWNGYTQFAQGKVPLAFGYPWWLSELKKGFGADYNRNFGVALFPGGTVTYGAMHYGHAYGVNKDSKHPAEVWKLLEWMSLTMIDDITPLGHYMAAIGSLPINRNDINSQHYSVSRRIYEGFINNLQYAVNDGEWGRWGAFPSLSSAVLSAVKGDSSPAEGIANLVRSMETNIAKQKEYLRELEEKRKKK